MKLLNHENIEICIKHEIIELYSRKGITYLRKYGKIYNQTSIEIYGSR